MADETLKIDENNRNVLGGITNDASEFIKNLRVNPSTGRLLVDAHLTSTNTEMGDTIPGGTAGSVLFLGLGSTLQEDNANFFWDDTNNRLGLGNNTPSATLDLVGTFQYQDGSETNGYVLTTDNSGNATWANLATSVTFITDLTSNPTFVTDLISNSFFTTTLANDTNFYTTLASNTFFTTLLSGLVAVVTDATLTGDGTTGSPLHVVAGAGAVLSVTDDGNGHVVVDNTDPQNPIIDFDGVSVDGVTITGTGLAGSPLTAVGGGSGITSINGDTTAAQLIVGGTGISISSSGGTTTITNTGGGGGSGVTKPKHFDFSYLAYDFPLNGYSDQEIYIGKGGGGGDYIIQVDIPGKVLQTYDVRGDDALATIIWGYVVKNGFLYLLIETSLPDRVVYRYDVNDLASGGTLMTISGATLGTTSTDIHMTSDGTDFFIDFQSGNSADSNIIAKYTLSGTTLTFDSNTTCGATTTSMARGVSVDIAGNYYGSENGVVTRFDNTGANLDTLTTSSTIETLYNWGNVLYAEHRYSSTGITYADRLEFPGLTNFGGGQTSIQFDDETGIPMGTTGTVNEFEITGGGVIAGRVSDKVTYTFPAVKPIKISSVFETATRFTVDISNGGTATFDAGGLTISTTGTSNRAAGVYMGIDSNSLYSNSPLFTAQFYLSAFAGTGSAYIGVDIPMSPPFAGSGITYLSDHFGFKILVAVGIASLYATQATGGTESASSALTTLNALTDTVEVMAQMNGSSSVSYYWRINGGAWSAATTLSTNVPVNAGTNGAFFCAAISNNNTSNTQSLTVTGFNYER